MFLIGTVTHTERNVYRKETLKGNFLTVSGAERQNYAAFRMQPIFLTHGSGRAVCVVRMQVVYNP
ncbi:hypothetical protein SAMN05216420_11648 [Nitrosospira sp. Nl5]|nr:hypothetical protein SAMN05216420_11648 [Nitrosospira sp. Nl5]